MRPGRGTETILDGVKLDGVKRLAVLLGLVLLVAPSCGGGGNKPLSKADYEAKMGEILRPLNPTLTNIARIDPSDREQAVAQMKKLETSLRDAASELSKLKPPEDAAAPTSQLADGIKRFADRLGAARKTAEQGNFLKLEQLKLGLASGPETQQVRAAASQLIGLGYNIAGNSP